MYVVHAHECVVHMPTRVQVETRAHTWTRATYRSVAILRQSLPLNQKAYHLDQAGWVSELPGFMCL